jgi:HK97 family phage major capsid protein
MKELRQRQKTITDQMERLYKAGVPTSESRAQFEVLDLAALELRRQMEKIEPEAVRTHAQDYDRAFGRYLRHGFTRNVERGDWGLTTEDRAILTREQERRAVTGGAGLISGGEGAYFGATSGFFCPLSFESEVTSAMKFAGPMLEPGVSTIDDTKTGTPRAYPTDNDTAVTGEQVAEQVAMVDDSNLIQSYYAAAGTFLNSYKYSSKMVLVSLELVRDQGVDLDAYLARRFGVRLGRIMNIKFTLGSGTGEPTGIATAAAGGCIAQGPSIYSPPVPRLIGWQDLINLELAVDPAYRLSGAGYMMHPSTWAMVRQITDAAGRPIYQGGQTINGYRVLLNPQLPQLPMVPNSPPASYKAVLFGDFSYYRIRRGPSWVVRLISRYAEQGLVAYLMMTRADGNLIDGGGNAVQALVVNY